MITRITCDFILMKKLNLLMKLPSSTCKKKKEKDFSVEKSISLTKSNLQYLLKKIWENKIPYVLTWWFLYLKSRSYYDDGIVHVWQWGLCNRSGVSVRAWLSAKYSVHCWKAIHLFARQMPVGWSPVTTQPAANKWHFKVKPEGWISWNWDHWCYVNI